MSARMERERMEQKEVDLHAAYTYQMLRLCSRSAGVPFDTVVDWFLRSFHAIVERESGNSAVAVPENREERAKQKTESVA